MENENPKLFWQCLGVNGIYILSLILEDKEERGERRIFLYIIEQLWDLKIMRNQNAILCIIKE